MSTLATTWYTVPEAAALLRVSARNVYDEIRRKRLKATRIGRCIRISDMALAEYTGEDR